MYSPEKRNSFFWKSKNLHMYIYFQNNKLSFSVFLCIRVILLKREILFLRITIPQNLNTHSLKREILFLRISKFKHISRIINCRFEIVFSIFLCILLKRKILFLRISKFKHTHICISRIINCHLEIVFSVFLCILPKKKKNPFFQNPSLKI